MFRALATCALTMLVLAACVSDAGTGVPTARASTKAPRGYERLFSPAPHAFRFSTSGEPVRRGLVSERFELRDGDCGKSDCGNARYRAEIREEPRTIRAKIGSDIWYGWSFYNGNIGAVSHDNWLGTVVGQWKLGGDQPPIFRFLQTVRGEGNWTNCDPVVCNRNSDASLDVVVDLEDISRALNWGPTQNYGNVCKLFSMQANQGKWVDIVVNTNFAATTEGYLRIWVNGELKCNYFGQLSSSKAVRNRGPGNRRGIFGSYTGRWTAKHGAAPKPTMIVYYDEFLVGRTRDDVDTRLREARNMPPKD